MRVLAIGGAGSMGRRACRLVARLDAVETLTVADVSLDAARKLAAELGPRAGAAQLDLTEPDAVRRSLDGIDVVLNTAGPFYRFGATALTAAIDCGCHYLDICDDWEPTLEMLALGERAEAAGVTAIVGLGASPGASNLLAMLAARELDSTSSLITGWNAEATQPEPGDGTSPSAAILHGFRQMTGTIRITRDGAGVDVPALRSVKLDYPGVGRRTALSFGHPEPVTLPQALPGISESVNVACAGRAVMASMKLMRGLVERGVVRAEKMAALAQRIELLLPAPKPARLFSPTGLPPVFALAVGSRGGRAASVGAALTGFPGTSMSAVTGTPLAVGLELLATGAITRRGVLPPELAIDPRSFLAALARHCAGEPGPADMAVLTRSWDADPAGEYRRAALAARDRLAAS